MSGNEEHDWKHIMRNDYQESHRLYDQIDMDDNYRLGLQDGIESGSKFWVGAISAGVLITISFGLLGLYMSGWQLP